jgi:hypothetical protein
MGGRPSSRGPTAAPAPGATPCTTRGHQQRECQGVEDAAVGPQSLPDQGVQRTQAVGTPHAHPGVPLLEQRRPVGSTRVQKRLPTMQPRLQAAEGLGGGLGDGAVHAVPVGQRANAWQFLSEGNCHEAYREHAHTHAPDLHLLEGGCDLGYDRVHT